jgi:F420-dependent oxidoreductase-like protein
MAGKRIRFGIQTPLVTDWQQTLEFWRFLDQETPIDSAWTFDHFIPPMGGQDPHGPCLEGWTALAALAQATERLRLGCLVTGVTYRHPSVLAKMAATVDHISGGRLEFGLGAAWHEGEHRCYGIPFPSIRERQDRLEEATELIRLLFETEGPVSYQGRYYQLEDAPFNPRPLQRPRPPFLIGGGGEKRTLRTLARFGDIMNVIGTPATLRRKSEVLEGHCKEVGRDPSEIERSVFVPVVMTDRQDVIDQIISFWVAQGISADEARRSTPTGPPDHIRDVIEQYADAGVTYFIMLGLGPYDRELYRRIMEEVVTPFV